MQSSNLRQIVFTEVLKQEINLSKEENEKLNGMKYTWAMFLKFHVEEAQEFMSV